MVNTQLKILRVFGPTGAEVSSVLRGIRDDGCPGLRLLERDGEFAICVQVSAPNRAMAEQYCEKWAARLRTKFGDDVFAEGETSLAQATLDALLEKRKLLVAVDETTGRLLGALLQPLPHSEAVFDFGTESYADAQKARRIAVPEQLLKRFPGDVVQAAAGRALAAMQVTGADFAAIEREFEGRGYGDFKTAVGESVVELCRPIREEANRLLQDKAYLESVYRAGAEKAGYIANKTLRKVYKKVGFVAR